MSNLMKIAVLMLCAAGCSFAGITQGPEIDPSTGVAAIALLSGGLLVLRSRRSKQ